MDTVCAATDISARHRIVPGPGDLHDRSHWFPGPSDHRHLTTIERTCIRSWATRRKLRRNPGNTGLPGGRPAQLVVGTTDDEWIIEWVTQEVVAVLGYHRDEVVGTALLAIVHPDSAADLVVALGHAHHGRGSAVVPVRLRRPSGVWSTHQMIVAPRPNDKPGVMFLLYPAYPPGPGATARPSIRTGGLSVGRVGGGITPRGWG